MKSKKDIEHGKIVARMLLMWLGGIALGVVISYALVQAGMFFK
jgi:hypothetical protein